MVRTLWITGAALLLDQASKWMVMNAVPLGASVPVFGSLFRLTYIHNPGAVFGLRLGGPYIHLSFAAGALILVVVLLWRMPAADRLGAIGLALILGGALGNAVDRVRFGVVIDFLDFGFGTLRWWVFNVADACVTIGTGLLMLSFGLQKGEKEAPDGDRDSSRA